MINDQRVILKTYWLKDFSRSCCLLSFLGHPPTMVAYFCILTGSTEVHDKRNIYVSLKSSKYKADLEKKNKLKVISFTYNRSHEQGNVYLKEKLWTFKTEDISY